MPVTRRLLDGTGDRGEYRIGIRSDESYGSNHNHKNHCQHDRVFCNILSVLFAPQSAYKSHRMPLFLVSKSGGVSPAPRLTGVYPENAPKTYRSTTRNHTLQALGKVVISCIPGQKQITVGMLLPRRPCALTVSICEAWRQSVSRAFSDFPFSPGNGAWPGPRKSAMPLGVKKTFTLP
jgi:hypothetical protein